MARIPVLLTDEQKEWLEKHSVKLKQSGDRKASVSELIRRAIELYMKREGK